MPRLHYTSRKVVNPARVYRGAETRVASETDTRSLITLDLSDPAGIECPDCGAYVKRLATGRPRTHGPGGYTTNTRKGQYKCSASGLA